MASPTDLVPVLRMHLEELYGALDAARGYHVADDLRTQYKNVGGTHRPSNLTKRLETALERTEAYLAEVDDDAPEG